MRRLHILTALAFLVPPLPAAALDCGSAMTQTDMNICAGRQYERADEALNQAYGAVMKKLAGDEEGRALLRRAQRAWIGFRDAECDLTTSGSEGGSIRPMLMAGCLTELTERRTRDLDALLECEEGDAACPLP